MSDPTHEFYLVDRGQGFNPTVPVFSNGNDHIDQPQEKRKDKKVKIDHPICSMARLMVKITLRRLTPRGQTSWHLPQNIQR